MRIPIIFLFAIAISVASAAEKTAKNTTAGVTSTKDSREKRNLNQFGANRRNDGYNYQPSGYNYEPSNYIGGGSAPSANDFRNYPEPLEPIIEIIIQDNNETLPIPAPIIQANGKKKKEQVQVFYVKYHKDEKTGLVIHDPIPALSPSAHNQEEEEYEEEPISIVTPVPPLRSTTLRTIIHPDSMKYESDSGVHVTFGSPHNHHSKSDSRIHDEEKVESAIRPVVQLPQSRIGPVGTIKEKREQFSQNQGRVVNSGPSPSFHQPQLVSNGLPANFHPPQQLVQSPPFQRPHPEFNPQNNFVQTSNQGQLSQQLSLPNPDPSKPFHPNFQHQQHQHNLRPQQPQQIPVHHQQQNQFVQQQNILGHQQFNQPPQRLPLPQPQVQQQPLLRPPQRPAVSANFNQNQRPFNYHAHATQQQSQPGQTIRFPNQPQSSQLQFQGPSQNFPPTFQQQQNYQRPQPQQLPPRQGPPQNFQNGQQLASSVNRPPPQFNARPSFPNQLFHTSQGPPQNFRPNQEHHQNQQVLQQNFEQNVFRGGLVQQSAPDLSNVQHRQQLPKQQQNQQFPSQDEAGFHQEQNNFIQNSFGSNIQVQSSVPKFEHHITETVNGPIYFQPTAVDMDQLQQEKNHNQQSSAQVSQHRFAVNNKHTHPYHVSNQYSEIFPETPGKTQKQFSSQSFLELNGRNNFSPEPREQPIIQSTPRPTTRPTTRSTTRSTTTATTTTEEPESTTTEASSVPSTTKKSFEYDLPDEVPDDLREQLLSSGILENAQISVLDYDKVGETQLTDLPPEHLANFFNAGGGAQIGASNKVISVLKPNGDSIGDKIKTLTNDRDVTKFLESSRKLPSRKEDVNLKVVRFDAQYQKNTPEQYIQKDSRILSSVNINQDNYNRYLPLKINGAQFPIPDVEELHGKKITSVVVLAPVNTNEDDSRKERDTVETKKIKFISGDSLKNLLRKPSSENYKKWLEREQKTNPDLQSVVLLVTNDRSTGEQEIFMYDIISKTVSRLSGELSSKFVDVAEENIFDDSTTIAEQIDRMDESVDLLEDAEAAPSNIIESVVKLDNNQVSKQPENKIVISSGYSVIKNE